MQIRSMLEKCFDVDNCFEMKGSQGGRPLVITSIFKPEKVIKTRLENAVRLFTVENTKRQPDREKVLMLIREADQVQSRNHDIPLKFTHFKEPSYSLSLW